MIKISKLKPNPENPRTIKDASFKKLVNSIKEFPKMMNLRPIIHDKQFMVIAGNKRLDALKSLGYKEIPEEWVRSAADLTEEEIKRFIIADNVTFGEHDFEALKKGWDVGQLEDWGIDMPEPVIVPKRTIETRAYKQVHILLSFAPDKMLEIQDLIAQIKDIDGIQYEQSSN